MVKKYHRRCHHFNDHGDPMGTGCLRGMSCRFVHPTDPEWDQLPSVPPFRRRPRTPEPRLLTRISPRHRQSHDQSFGFGGQRYRSPSPLSPTSALHIETHELRDHRGRAGSTASSVLSYTNKGDTASMGGRPPPTRTAQPQSMQSSDTRTPTFSTPTTMLLPLLPAPPALLSVKQPARAELAFDQKRKAWADYVRIMSDTLQQREKLTRLDGDINLVKRVANLSSTGPIPDASKTGVEAKLTKLESQREEAMKNYDAILARAMAVENWPVSPPVDSEEKETLNKTAKYSEELLHKIEEINHVLSRSVSVLPSDSLIVGDTSRPLKRRRVDETGREEQQETRSVASAPDIQEELRDRVLAVHEAIANVQNFQTVTRNDLVTEYKEYVDTKVEEASVEMTKIVGERAQVLDSSITLAENDVSELAGEIEKLVLDNNSIREEITGNNQRIRDTEARVAQLEQRLQELTEGRDQFAKVVEALQGAQAAHVARPISPPVSPNLPPIEYIVQTVHDPLLEAARTAIKPLLVNAKEDIQGLLKERDADMYQTLWRRLASTLKAVDGLSARLAPNEGASSAS